MTISPLAAGVVLTLSREELPAGRPLSREALLPLVRRALALRRLGQLEGDLRVLPGHMEASTLDRERRWNPYLLQAMQ